MDTKNSNKNLKLRVFTIFRSSCRDTSLSDITAQSSNPKLLHHHPKHPFPSITKKPMTPTTTTTTIIPSKPDPARQKLSESYSLFYSAHSAPLLEKQRMDKTKKKKKHTRRRRTRARREMSNNASFWSSSEEDENDSLLLGSRGMKKKKKKMVELEQEQHQRRQYEMGMEDDSYAVVKCSKDPYMDFRTSMVEMIVMKRMKKAEDLERLLQCFLKLNSYRHHPVIIEAFMDIWDALFL